MPYQGGDRLPAERASRLGHLAVLQSELVNTLCRSFESTVPGLPQVFPSWKPIIATNASPLPLVFGVDGSLQIITSETPPHKTLAFVKTALLRLDSVALGTLDKDTPNPFALRDILAESALYHATVFPLRHIAVAGMSVYDAVRQTVFESLKDASLGGEPFETLKWLAYEKWQSTGRQTQPFICPHCSRDTVLPYDADVGTCVACKGRVYLSDLLGFHQEMTADAAPDIIASNYMMIHETLLLLTGVRYFWNTNRAVLSRCLFVKDGPLSLRAQYSKLVPPIRRFMAHARDNGHPACIVGQEKSGRFFDHLQLVGRGAPAPGLFIPSDSYIKREIQYRPDTGQPYGSDTNYGSKLFVSYGDHHQMVLSIPTGEFVQDPERDDFIGLDRILATLPSILSSRHEGALLPIELAHGVASLSTYPSARILKVFADSLSSH